MSQQSILNERFAVAPSTVSKPRSTFMIPFNHKTTANFGDVVPLLAEWVMPGDTLTVDTKLLARMSTPLYPVMDNAYIQHLYFFCPMWLLWTHTAEFFGENKLSAWVQPIDYKIPHFTAVPEPGSLMDHMNVPTYENDATLLASFGLTGCPEARDINALFFRAYLLIWNEWFRNENTTDPILVNTGDNVTSTEVNMYSKLGYLGVNGSGLLKASRLFDPFSTALPAPQKGGAIDVPIFGMAPLVVGDLYDDWASQKARHQLHLTADPTGSTRVPLTAGDIFNLGFHVDNASDPANPTGHVTGADWATSAAQNYDEPISLTDLRAALSETDSFTVNQLRYAFQLQRILERQAIGGSRLVEVILNSFGVRSSDARLRRPEYLGGTRQPLGMTQVTQTSSTDLTSPLGHTGAYSKTAYAHHDFSKSFNDFGFLFCVAVARHRSTYQQGLPRKFSAISKYSIFWPELDHIGFQPVYNRELFMRGTKGADGLDLDGDAFGYQEAHWWYRFFPDQVSGQFRSTIKTNLDEWHWADVYDDVPTLSQDWMNADHQMVDRTLAVSSAIHDQLIFDYNCVIKASRVMSLFSTPGLIDHF